MMYNLLPTCSMLCLPIYRIKDTILSEEFQGNGGASGVVILDNCHKNVHTVISYDIPVHLILVLTFMLRNTNLGEY